VNFKALVFAFSFNKCYKSSSIAPLSGAFHIGGGKTRDDLFREDLKSCAVIYDFEKKLGVLRLPPGACCDMSGCIHLFLSFAPDVQRIDVFSGAGLDTSYVCRGDSWESFRPGEPSGRGAVSTKDLLAAFERVTHGIA
jgi:hypothetical protein